MEQEMDAGKFWLPTEFLKDEGVLMNFNYGKQNAGIVTENKGMSTLYGPNSDLNSPVESVIGSTETESDEEDYLNELSRKLAQSTLEDSFWESETIESTRCIARSPQSILCGCKQISSRGSPDGFSPAVPLSRNESALDLLHSAADEVARLRMEEELGSKYYNPHRSIVASQQRPREVPSQNFQFHEIQAAQLKHQQLMKQHHQYQQFVHQNRAMNGDGNMNRVSQPLSAWPALHQSQQPRPAPGSGMRAVFLGNRNAKRECTGTGVFLPRQSGAPIEPHKKRGCSTVLLPDRVVEALNLNLEPQTRSNGRRLGHDYDAEMRYRNSVFMAEQRWLTVENDLPLPQEWTY